MTHQADLLRMAAAKMTERANAAPPGPWFATGKSTRYGGIVTAPTDTHPEDEGYGGHLIGESMSPESREHVASWHPAVALAVAAWIEAHARDIEGAFGNLSACDSPSDVESALAVARAYLGEQP